MSGTGSITKRTRVVLTDTRSAELYAGLSPRSFERRELTGAGDQVLVDTALHARGRTTGIDVEQHAFVLWTLREGMAVKAVVFAERGPALEAAGLEE